MKNSTGECCEKCICKCRGAVTAHYGCDNRICPCHFSNKEKETTTGDGSVRCCDNGDMDEGTHPDHLTSSSQSAVEEWEKEFETMIQRGSMPHKPFRGTSPYIPLTDLAAEVLKSFISRLLSQSREEGKQIVMREIEAEMLDKIYYIGHELPQVKEDVRDKFVLLGFPQKFLDDVKARSLLNSLK